MLSVLFSKNCRTHYLDESGYQGLGEPFAVRLLFKGKDPGGFFGVNAAVNSSLFVLLITNLINILNSIQQK